MLAASLRSICILLYLIPVSTAALAERRVALVIGNSAYRHASELTNPRNDAADMAAALKALGFEVVDGIDLDKAGMDGKLREFADRLSGADAALFFYAGHGLQVSGVNYLAPIDARLTTAAALNFEMVRLDLIQQTMEAEAQTNILFLDACRDNPLARNLARAMGTRSGSIGRGLAAAESGIGTLISYSTQPGNVALDGSGRNSPFAAALVARIKTDNDALGDLLIAVRNDVMQATAKKQVPWEHSALTGKFYFRTPSQKPAAAPAREPSTAMLKTERRGSDQCKGTIAKVGGADRCVLAREIFKDCPDCPEMVVIPAGSFAMAWKHEVNVPQALAVGRFEVTFADWDKCATGGGCTGNPEPSDAGVGRGRNPVVNVSWRDTQEYVAWLTSKTGNRYRLLSDAEWEYAARAGTSTAFAPGDSLSPEQANFNNSRGRPVAVGSYPANAFGLYDVHGNASEWVQDCWNDAVDRVPADASPRQSGDCNYHVIRGGSWAHDIANSRIDARFKAPASGRGRLDGFRVARDLE
jgi:formylglycine-generating enzyme required for sulfatase activity